MKYRRLTLAILLPAIVVTGAAIELISRQSPPRISHQLTAAQLEELKPPEETFNPVFEPCAHCHQIGKGARNSNGPVLTGVIGREAASTNYPYSAAMRSSGLVWDETTLRAFIKNPHQLVPGTRMAFPGLPEDKIGPLLAFIRSVSGS